MNTDKKLRAVKLIVLIAAHVLTLDVCCYLQKLSIEAEKAKKSGQTLSAKTSKHYPSPGSIPIAPKDQLI